MGGSFADGALLANGTLVRRVKLPSQPSLSGSIISIIDSLTPDESHHLSKLILSTTLVTNLIAAGRFDPVGIILISSKIGLEGICSFPFPSIPVNGYVDFRGNVRRPLDITGLIDAVRKLEHQQIQNIAVVSKFSNRNPELEHQAMVIIENHFPTLNVLTGHHVWNGLNFPRRVMGAALSLAVRRPVRDFFHNLLHQLQQRGIQCPVEILKADGGTFPLEGIFDHPLETIYSGPAASAMGCIALTPPGLSAFFIDIGGSTCDIGLILDDRPLISKLGLRINGAALPIHGFCLSSIACGGDSPVQHDGNLIYLSSQRNGPPAVSGGASPTLTDAARVLNYHDSGSPETARSSFTTIASSTGLSVEDIARRAVAAFQKRIQDSIHQLIRLWQQEPAYRIWELRNRRTEPPRQFILLGAGGQYLQHVIQEIFPGDLMVPENGDIANALGAALSRPTFSTTLHADTRQKGYSILEINHWEPLPNTHHFKLPQADQICREWAIRKAQDMKIEPESLDLERVLGEQFNVLQEHTLSERIIDVQYINSSGLIPDWRREPH